MDLAVVSDLHDAPYEDLWPLLEGADCLLVPGDVVNRYMQSASTGLRFLDAAARRLPTFFSIGNHEMLIKDRSAMLGALRKSRATMLLNDYILFEGLWIGGWYRPYLLNMRDIADEFERLEGCKVLMCHRPEDYRKHLRGRDIDLVVAGHAHGGQVRIGGQGLYSPGQGFFPRMTRGVVDGRMIVSAGASNPVRMPRWGNPCEILRIQID
jgi:predicted MPP superfamily phosphohydrolase